MKFIYIPYLDELNAIKKEISDLQHDFEASMEKYKEKPGWSYEKLHHYIYIRPEFIFEHSEIRWNLLEVSHMNNLSIDFIRKFGPSKFYWDILSESPKYTTQDFIDNIDLPWRVDKVCYKSNITMERFNAIPGFRDKLMQELRKPHIPYHLFPNLHIDWLIAEKDNVNWPWESSRYSCIQKITINHIINHPDIPWNMKRLSEIIPINDILANKHMKWDWNIVSESADTLTFDMVMKYPDIPWNWETLSRRFYIPWDYLIDNGINFDLKQQSRCQPLEIVKDNLHYTWDWDMITARIDSFNIILKNPHLPWNYRCIKCEVPAEFIMDNIRLDWDTSMITRVLPWEFIKENPEIVEWDCIEILRKPGIIFEDLLPFPPFMKNIDSYCCEMLKLGMISDEIIDNHPEIKWNLSYYAFNYNKKCHGLLKKYDEIMKKFIKENIYYKLVNRMHRPGGYYYKKDMEFIIDYNKSVNQ